MKIAIIRCQLTEDMCGGLTCLRCASKGKAAFQEINKYEEDKIDVIGFVSCGGCSGKKIIPRAQMLISKGAEMIFLASCIGKGTPINFVCPHFSQIKESLQNIPDLKLIDWTH